MSASAVCESLESRSLYAATPTGGLDPDFVFDSLAIRRIAGKGTKVYEALPAPGDKTYLLAERYDPTRPPGGKQGYLTLARITADGKLDPSFGTNGVALTGRLTEARFDNGYTPGLMKLDDAGRLYFADNTRVVRFRPNGATDRTFGTNGSITFADSYRSLETQVALCDIAPNDNGVYIATTLTEGGEQYFAVQQASGQGLRTVWTTTHEAQGAPTEHGEGEFDGEPNGKRYLLSFYAQFAQSRGGLVLARLERNFPDPNDDYGRGDIVVTRFDIAGHGTDVFRAEERQAGNYGPPGIGSLKLSNNGRYLSTVTSAEGLRLDLKTRAIKRYDLPPHTLNNAPDYQLLSDGNRWAIDQQYTVLTDPSLIVAKTSLDGTLDRTFAHNGVLRVPFSKLFGKESFVGVEQIFLGVSGRLYVLCYIGDYLNLTMLRV